MDTPEQTQQPESRASEPIFNIAGVVVAVIVLCTAIHATRRLVFSPGEDFEFLLKTAFIPLRYSSVYVPDFYAFSSPMTYSFLHGDGIHLAINMIWLAAFGSPLANRIGVIRFAGFWIFTSAGAVLLHYLLHSNDPAMVIGASGAVSGMMAAAARFGFRVDRRERRPAFNGPRLTISQMSRQRMVVVFWRSGLP